MLSLGTLESAIMDRAWQADHPLSTHEVLRQLRYERPVAAQTVFTVMERLRHKGWLARRKHGRAYRYWATGTRAEDAARVMGRALADGEDRTATLEYFVSGLSPGELDDLRMAMENPALPLRAPASSCPLCQPLLRQV